MNSYCMKYNLSPIFKKISITLGQLSLLIIVGLAYSQTCYAHKQNVKQEIATRKAVASIYGDTNKPIVMLKVTIGEKSFIFPDERYGFVDESGQFVYYNEPGLDYHVPGFFLSLDQNYLLVVRNCMHRVTLGYLYRRKDNRFEPFHIKHLRLDDAALAFLKGRRVPTGTLKDGDRIFNFVSWSKDSKYLTFTMLSGEYSVSKDKLALLRFDLSKEDFKLISIE